MMSVSGSQRVFLGVAAVVTVALLLFWLLAPDALPPADGRDQASTERGEGDGPPDVRAPGPGTGARTDDTSRSGNPADSLNGRPGAVNSSQGTEGGRASGAAQVEAGPPPADSAMVPQTRPVDPETALPNPPETAPPNKGAADTQQCVVTISGIVVDSTGAPVGNAGVVVSVAYDDLRRRAADGVGMGSQPTGRSKPDGTFRFRFRYSASSGERTTALLMAAMRTTGFAVGDAQEFVARDGRELTGIRLVVPDVGTLSGRVVDAGGQPAARIKVRATRSARNAHVMTTALSGTDGRFVFDSLKAGEYVLRAEGVDVFGPLEGVAIEAVADREVALEKDIVVCAGGTLVINLSASGKSVANQTFGLRFLDRFDLYAGDRGARADADGIIRFHGLPAGETRFFVTGEGFRRTKVLTFQIASGQERRYGSLTLEPAEG